MSFVAEKEDAPTLTEAQVRIVGESWNAVSAIADDAAQLFYDRLFEIDPSTRALFRGSDMAAQRKKLMQALAFSVSRLDMLDELHPVIEDLGRRHAGYGVADKHYESVGAALLWTLERGLGEQWTNETRDAWAAVYFVLSDIMRAAGGAD